MLTCQHSNATLCIGNLLHLNIFSNSLLSKIGMNLTWNKNGIQEKTFPIKHSNAYFALNVFPATAFNSCQFKMNVCFKYDNLVCSTLHFPSRRNHELRRAYNKNLAVSQ